MAPEFEVKLISSQVSFEGEQRLYRQHSSTLGRDIDLEIYVPATQLHGKACVVVYYLPSLETSAHLVATQSDFQRYANRYDCIVVTPGLFASYHGNEDERIGQYWKEYENIDKYITESLPFLMDQNFKVFDFNSIMGYGFGGSVALNLALKNRKHYRSASALAPWVGFYGTPWFEAHLAQYQVGAEIDPLTNLNRHYEEAIVPIWIDQGENDAYLDKQIQLLPFQKKLEAHPNAENMWINWHKRYDHSFYFVHTHIREHFVFHAEFHEST